MTRRVANVEKTSFLVEHYLPGKRRDELETLVDSIRAALADSARAGNPLRLLHATVVPEDESVLCVIGARSEQAVRSAYGVAGIDFDRISTAIADDPSPTQGDARHP